MSQRSEILFKCPSDNEPIYLQRWQPATSPKAIVLITHGVAEHSECYHHTGEALAKNNLDVWAWDLPGHGKSYGQRGYVKSFSEYTERLKEVLAEVRRHSDAKIPIFLLGHSMGGMITFQFALANPTASVKAYILSSPAFGVKVQVPFVKDQAARVLMHVAPKLTIPHQIIYEDLTRDAELVKTYYKDPLRHTKFSAPLYLGILDAMESAQKRAYEFTMPLLIQAAGQDKIVDVLATQEIFAKIGSPQKTLKIYPESFHEIFNDTNKQEVIDDFLAFLRGFNI
jgi:alpha-beta hydrolase superfamily lysophospholipase